MSESIQLSPSLAIYDDDGELTIRTSDQGQWKLITPQVLKAIGDSLHPRKVTLVTPTDTKVFKFGHNGKGSDNAGHGSSTGTERTVAGDADAVKPVEAATEDSSDHRGHPQEPVRGSQRIHQDPGAPPAPEIVADVQEDFEQELRKQQQEQAEVERVQREQATAIDSASKVKSRERPQPEARTEIACGRCYGQGVLEGGGTCPVCRGKRVIAKWGRGRK